MIEELKKEEAKYRKSYDDGNIFDGLNADAFKIAILKLESKGIQETYKFFKSEKDKYSDSHDRLGRSLAHAYNLVLGKLWKYYKKEGKSKNMDGANTE